MPSASAEPAPAPEDRSSERRRLVAVSARLSSPVLASRPMAHVVFALGDRPGLSQVEALELAELLARKRSLAAQSASRKIRLEANRDPDRGEKSKDIELTREELEALEAVLDEVRDQEELPRFERLRNEVLQALREGPPPSGRLGQMRP